jgi:hypothetical protein
MYRLGLEAILDVTKRGDSLLVNPRVPSAWREFSIEYRYARSVYAILVRSPADLDGDVVAVSLDGRELDGPAITLIDDGARLRVIIEPGRHDQQTSVIGNQVDRSDRREPACRGLPRSKGRESTARYRDL